MGTTAATIRSPGRPNGRHDSAWTHAKQPASKTAGHHNGKSIPSGRNTQFATASQATAMAAVPYSMGQPTRARVVSGKVNIRGGKVDSLLAISASKP